MLTLYSLRDMLRYNSNYAQPVFNRYMEAAAKVEWDNYKGAILLISTSDGNVYLGELQEYNPDKDVITVSDSGTATMDIKVSDITECYIVFFEKII